MKTDFAKFCTPAKLYFAIAIISCIFALFNNVTFLAIFMKLIFAFVWTYILNWICSKGYKTISWVLVLLPYIIILFAMLMLMNKPSTQQQTYKPQQRAQAHMIPQQYAM